MSLISFPFDNSNIKNRVYAEGTYSVDNPPGYTRVKREVSYTVPSDSKAIFSPSFYLSFAAGSTEYEKKSLSFVDYLNPGDIVYMGVWLYASPNSPFNRYYEIFYQVNGVTRFSNTMSPTGGSTITSIVPSCYYFSVEIDK